MKKAIICAFLGLNLSTAMGKFESGFGQREDHFHGLEQVNGESHGDKLEVLRGPQRLNIDGPRDLKDLFQRERQGGEKNGERRERSEGNRPERRRERSEGWNRQENRNQESHHESSRRGEERPERRQERPERNENKNHQSHEHSHSRREEEKEVYMKLYPLCIFTITTERMTVS